MSELDEVLREVARHVLGLPSEAKDSVSSLKKALGALPPNFKEMLTALGPDKQSPKNPRQSTASDEAVEVAPKPPSVRPDGGAQKPAASDRDLLRRLRESEKKLQKKADEAEKLRARLQKAQKAIQEAQSARGRAEQEAAYLRKDLSRVAEERDRLSAEIAKVREESAKLKAEKGVLEEQVKGHKKRVDELEARVRELEGLAVQKEHLEAQLARLSSFKETLPEPFPQEALLRVLVLDYPSLADKAEERVMTLIEGYRAFLKGEDHPALRHSNRQLLVGEPEGMVLVGLEKLLLDLASLPLARWLRTHAFRLEALLQEGQQLSSPRLREE